MLFRTLFFSKTPYIKIPPSSATPISSNLISVHVRFHSLQDPNLLAFQSTYFLLSIMVLYSLMLTK